MRFPLIAAPAPLPRAVRCGWSRCVCAGSIWAIPALHSACDACRECRRTRGRSIRVRNGGASTSPASGHLHFRPSAKASWISARLRCGLEVALDVRSADDIEYTFAPPPCARPAKSPACIASHGRPPRSRRSRSAPGLSVAITFAPNALPAGSRSFRSRRRRRTRTDSPAFIPGADSDVAPYRARTSRQSARVTGSRLWDRQALLLVSGGQYYCATPPYRGSAVYLVPPSPRFTRSPTATISLNLEPRQVETPGGAG